MPGNLGRLIHQTGPAHAKNPGVLRTLALARSS